MFFCPRRKHQRLCLCIYKVGSKESSLESGSLGTHHHSKDCQTWEQLQRQFLWNEDNERRKFHLVSWTQECKLKRRGVSEFGHYGSSMKPCWGSSYGDWATLQKVYGRISFAWNQDCIGKGGESWRLLGGIMVFVRGFVLWPQLLIAIFDIVFIQARFPFGRINGWNRRFWPTLSKCYFL